MSKIKISNSGSARKINHDGLPITPQNIKPPAVKPPKKPEGKK